MFQNCKGKTELNEINAGNNVLLLDSSFEKYFIKSLLLSSFRKVIINSTLELVNASHFRVFSLTSRNLSCCFKVFNLIEHVVKPRCSRHNKRYLKFVQHLSVRVATFKTDLYYKHPVSIKVELFMLVQKENTNRECGSSLRTV